MINSIGLVCFSPTKTTKRIVETIARGINITNSTYIDLTSKTEEFKEFINELVIIGVPVYSGRVPVVAAKRLSRIKGNNTPAIIVAVYGNRDYEDALIELRDIVIKQGFMPFAAAAFIGEHSFSSESLPIAKGRPDKNDLIKADRFGAEIRNMINECEVDNSIVVPGNNPYKVLGEMPNISPITIHSKCDRCGVCVSVCPTGSIHLNSMLETDSTTCILCCACVKECPNNARFNDSEIVKFNSEWLSKNCSTRREPEIFIN